jgi:hypothetical protein
MSFVWNHVILVKSCHSCEIMSFLWNHVIHANSCQIMSNQVIHVNTCQFTSIHAIMTFAIGLFRKFSIVGGRGGREGSNMSSQAFSDSFAVRPKAKSLGQGLWWIWNPWWPLNDIVWPMKYAYLKLLSISEILVRMLNACTIQIGGNNSTTQCPSIAKLCRSN